MPTDRRITIRLEPTSLDEDDDDVVLNVWATIRDENLERVIELGRMSRETVRRWRVRWDDRIYDHPLVLLKVVDRGDTFGILNVAEVSRQGRNEPGLRRRFMDLQGVYAP